MQPSLLPILVATAAISLASPSRSDACSKRHQTPFELFAEASTVAVVHVRKTPSNSPTRIVAGDVELAVTQLIKGPKATTIIAQEHESSCRARYILDTDAIVFLRPDGLTVGAHDGHLRDAAAWRPVIERWAAATDLPARLAVLIDAIAGDDKQVADEGVDYLVDQPALLNLVTPEQRAVIAKAAKQLAKDPVITMLLVRLRDPSAPSRASAAIWARAARGFLQTPKIAAETDIAKLADIVEHGRRDADPRRIAAMERCERLHGSRLIGFGRYFAGAGSQAFWRELAEVCRTGTPVD